MTNYKSANSSEFAFFFLKTYTMKRLMLFAAGIFFLLNTNAQKNRNLDSLALAHYSIYFVGGSFVR